MYGNHRHFQAIGLYMYESLYYMPNSLWSLHFFSQSVRSPLVSYYHKLCHGRILVVDHCQTTKHGAHVLLWDIDLLISILWSWFYLVQLAFIPKCFMIVSYNSASFFIVCALILDNKPLQFALFDFGFYQLLCWYHF